MLRTDGLNLLRKFTIREYRICEGGDDVPIATIKAWLERLLDIIKYYEPCNQWNMNELGLFFKALPDKGLVKKKKSSKGGKKSKKRMTVDDLLLQMAQSPVIQL